MENDEEDHALVADEEAPTEFALMANTSTESKVFDNSLCSKDCKKNNDSLNTSKDLDNLIESQRADKNKEGLGHSAVPPPPLAQLYSSSKKDLSWTGLPECKDDTVTDYSRPEPNVESSPDDDKKKNTSVSETVASPIIPKPFVKFVKASDSQSKSKIDETETPKKSLVIEFGDSYEVPTSTTDTTTTDTTSGETGTKSGRTVTLTAKDMQKKKNDVKARTTLLLSLPDEHQLRFNGVGWDWSYMANDGEDHALVADEEALTEFALMANTSTESKDLSWTGLPECKDDTVTNYSRLEPTIESSLYDEKKRNPSVSETIVSPIIPKPFVKFVKACNSQSESKTNETETPKKSSVKNFPPVNRKFSTGSRNFPTANRKFPTASRKFPTGSTKFSTADMGMKGKAIKPSACWGSSQNKINDKGYWDIGYTRHMIGNISYLFYMCLLGKEDARLLEKELSKLDETSGILKKFIFEIENLKDLRVKIIRTPQQNGVAKRRNRTLIEAAKTMLADAKLPVTFWAEAVNTACTKDVACQEVKKDVSTLRYIALPNWAHDAFLESSSSKSQDDCNTDVLESSGNTNPTATSTIPLADQVETLTVESPILTANIIGVTTNSEESNGVEADVSNMKTTITASPTPTLRIHRHHPKSQIIGQVDTPIQTRNKSKQVGEQSFIATIPQKTDPALLQLCLFSCFLSQVEPKKISDALRDPSWVEAMQEELLQFKIQKVWTLVDCPKGVRPIGIKWVLKNKKDERGIVIRNKARLVAQGHTQEEGIDYDEVFAPVARIKAIRLFLAYTSFMGFTVYQMDVKSTFLYGTIDEEVYVMQPPGFQDPEYPARVYKVEKTMYGLHQAPRAWRMAFFSLKTSMWVISSRNLDIQMSDLQILPWIRSWGKDGTGIDVDLHLYRSMIGSLMYLTASRPDIMFAICACDRHQFWSTARIETTDEGTKILATVDCILRTVTESSIRCNLKLNDEGEGSGTPTEPHHTPSPELQPSTHIHISSPTLPTVTTIPTVTPSETTSLRQYTRRARIAQSSALPPVADEPASPKRDVSQGEACPTDSGFVAYQDKANIAKTSTLPHESTSRVTSLAADEGSLQLQEGINLFGDDAPIKGRRLDEEEVATKRVSSDTEEIRLDEGEVAAKKVSDDIEEMATVLITMDAASVLSSGGIQVVLTAAAVAPANVSISTGSGMVPTASTIISTATPIFSTATTITPYTKRKGKEKMVETHTPKKKKRLQEQIDIQFARELEEELKREAQRMNAQISRDEEIAKIHAEEELQQII
nr:putative ribonuclease H-like domain-containing protein [Tanacetum cinerariifolium]